MNGTTDGISLRCLLDLLPREQVGVEPLSDTSEAQLSKQKKPRDRAFQKRVRERMTKTGEAYQLAARRLTGEDGSADSLVPPEKPAHLRTHEEFDAEIRRRRAAPPLRPQYPLEITATEAAFGFEDRLVRTPMRMANEPDRMHAVAVELSGIVGHFFAIKLLNGGYEIRGIEGGHESALESFSSLDELSQRYGSYRRIIPDPSLQTTHLPRLRLATAISERFPSDFAEAVYFADPTTGGPRSSLMVVFGDVQFEIIDDRVRYARFIVDYFELPRKQHDPAGRLRGEVTWPVGATLEEDKLFMDQLVLVELHATAFRPVGQGTGSRRRNKALLTMMQHLRDHTGEVEIDDAPHTAGDARPLEDPVAYLYVLEDGRRGFPRAEPALKARVTDDECAHLLRAGAWRVVRDQVASTEAARA